MKELTDRLNDILKEDHGMVVTLEINIPNLIVRIHDSRSMFLYGIEKTDSPGHTLLLNTKTNTKTGQQLISESNEHGLMSNFIHHKTKYKSTFLLDFKNNSTLLVKTLNNILETLGYHENLLNVDFKVTNMKGSISISED